MKRIATALVAATVTLGFAATAVAASTTKSLVWAGAQTREPTTAARYAVSAQIAVPQINCTVTPHGVVNLFVGFSGLRREQVGIRGSCVGNSNTWHPFWHVGGRHGGHLAPKPRSGDMVKASVTITGDRYQLVLRDVTRNLTLIREAVNCSPTKCEHKVAQIGVSRIRSAGAFVDLADFVQADFSGTNWGGAPTPRTGVSMYDGSGKELAQGGPPTPGLLAVDWLRAR